MLPRGSTGSSRDLPGISARWTHCTGRCSQYTPAPSPMHTFSRSWVLMAPATAADRARDDPHQSGSHWACELLPQRKILKMAVRTWLIAVLRGIVLGRAAAVVWSLGYRASRWLSMAVVET